MRRFLLSCALAAALMAPAAADDRERVAAARQAVRDYLELRLRAAAWEEFADFVLWSEESEPECSEVVRSYRIDKARLKDRRTALVTVVFYRLGALCPGPEFRRAAQLDTAVFQLQRRSGEWRLEKTSRPGAHVHWEVARDQLQRRLGDPATPGDEAARTAAALEALQKTASAIGETSSRKPNGATEAAPQ